MVNKLSIVYCLLRKKFRELLKNRAMSTIFESLPTRDLRDGLTNIASQHISGDFPDLAEVYVTVSGDNNSWGKMIDDIKKEYPSSLSTPIDDLERDLNAFSTDKARQKEYLEDAGLPDDKDTMANLFKKMQEKLGSRSLSTVYSKKRDKDKYDIAIASFEDGGLSSALSDLYEAVTGESFEKFKEREWKRHKAPTVTRSKSKSKTSIISTNPSTGLKSALK